MCALSQYTGHVRVTPIERRADVWVKRDDLYVYAGQRGGKVRTCRAILTNTNAAGVVTAGSRHSPQVEIVSALAKHMGLKCRVHVPTGDNTPQIEAALENDAQVLRHRPGYNSVIVARCREDARASGWAEVPFGMECQEAVTQTAAQVESILPYPARRIVVPVGSGMTLAGIINGMLLYDHHPPIVGVVVGADPVPRLDAYAPTWRFMDVSLQPAGPPYSTWVTGVQVGRLPLDPVYEAKCEPYLRTDDLLWIVGHRGAANLYD
jgi:1-aminocyclopropane-1-carboxylate deaminase/D-cysteine desulfhydrase-like pyridoxal-dependent ACC family enzyme